MIAVAKVAPLLRAFGAAAPISTPSLTVVDHADGTGATATIGLAAVGSTNVVYVQSIDGDFGGDTWQALGTRLGNGTVELALAAGHYFVYAASALGDSSAVSSVQYASVTAGQESLHTRVLNAVQSKIRSLALDDLPSGQVVIRKLPVDRGLTGNGGIGLPAIVISPRGAAMPADSGTNGLDDVYYEVLVAILDRDNQEPTLRAGLDRHLLWREQIFRAFRNQRLGGVSEIIHAEVEPAEGLLSEAWKNELLASALLVRFTSRETRGI